jgi:hypothetical protein
VCNERLLIFANGGSTPREDHITVINEQLLNQGFAAVKRPERKSPEAKHVVNVSAGTVALAVNRMSLLGQRDAAVESKMIGWVVESLNSSASHYFRSSGRQEIGRVTEIVSGTRDRFL